jgi:hypothetical protein
MLINKYASMGRITYNVDFTVEGGGTGGEATTQVFVGHRMIRVMLHLPHPPHDFGNMKVLTADQLGQWFNKVVPPSAKLNGVNGGDYYYCPKEKCVREFVSSPRPLVEQFGMHTGWGLHPWTGNPTFCPVDCDDYAAIFWGEARRMFGSCSIGFFCGTPDWTSFQSHAFNLGVLELDRAPGEVGLFAIDTTNYMQGMREIDLSVAGGSPQTNIWAAVW